MSDRRVWLALLPGLLLAGSAANGAEPPILAHKIDQILANRWAEAKVEPVARADDAEFLRRAYLDLTGRIPSVEETRSFLDDKAADKRAQLVDRLVTGPRYATHFTNVWRARLLPEAGNNFQVRLQQPSFETWLHKQLARNAGYDQMVRDLLTAPVGGGGALGFAAIAGEPGPLTYYIAKELKPENLAASTARQFLGVSVECAQCHNHPFAEWKKEQFWGFAAFYSGLKINRQMDFLLPGGEDAAKHELTIPGTQTVVQAKFLDGTEPTWKSGTNSRAALADWVTAKENPYFARAAANRMWAYFLGVGLIEPVDEMARGPNKAQASEALDLLATEFAEHHFDLKFLIRTVTATKAYQLSSAGGTEADPTLFTRMPLRGLTGEQLFDSVVQATGYRDSGGGDDLLSALRGGNRSARTEFLTKFAPSGRPIDAETSILQALSLMNGKVTVAATTLERSETLAAVTDAPFLTTSQRIETLYLATLGRKPEKKEIDRSVKFVEDAMKDAKNPDSARNNALADVFWALLNSTEFALNH
jgi:hypothetical protein